MLLLIIMYLQEHLGRDLKDPRLDMMKKAQTSPQHSTQLWTATRQGNIQQVKRLVSMGNNPMAKDPNNDTALHIAAAHGRIQILKYLIEDQGCNPASLGWHGTTSLHMAAEFKHLSIVQYLVTQHQVDSLEQDDNGYSSLHRACQGGDLPIVKYIFNTILTYMNIQDVFNDFTQHNTSPIDVAALNGHLHIVNYFILDLKCDPNLPDSVDGRGPIFQAAQEGHLSIVKSLIVEHGCNPAYKPGHPTTLGCKTWTSTYSGLPNTRNKMRSTL